MRKGTVTNDNFYGTIKPSDGGADVFYNPPAVRPANYWPPVDTTVEFEVYVGDPSWAKLVRKV